MKQSLKILAICFKIFFLFAPLATGQSVLSGKRMESHKVLQGIELNFKITDEYTNVLKGIIMTEQKQRTLLVSHEGMLLVDISNNNSQFAAAPSEADLSKRK